MSYHAKSESLYKNNVASPSTTNASGSLRYGDIELFLMGLQLGHLVSLFKV